MLIVTACKNALGCAALGSAVVGDRSGWDMMGRLVRAVDRPVRLWLVAFLGFFLMAVAWSIAMPYNGAPDEQSHILRAAGVFSDPVPEPTNAAKGTGAMQAVPRGLVVAGRCWEGRYWISAACSPGPNGSHVPVQVGTTAGRYFPLYYLIVGLPLRIWPTMGGVLFARAISAALGAALLASAFVLVMRFSRYRLGLASLLLSVTPMVMHLCGAINPNGLEAAAAIAMFAAGIPMLSKREPLQPKPGMVVVLILGAATLVMLRSGGPMWLLLAAAALLLPLRRALLSKYLRNRAMRIAAIVVALSGIVAMVWTTTMRSAELIVDPPPTHITSMQAFFLESEHWKNYLFEMIGVAGWLDVTCWQPMYYMWLFFAGAIVVFALMFGSRGDRWRISVLIVGCYCVSTVFIVLRVNQYGFVNQGRYMLPMFAGAMLLSATVLEERGLPIERIPAIVKSSVLLFGSMHMMLLVYAMVRYQRGLAVMPTVARLNPLSGPWHPVLGSLTALGAELVGIVIISVLAWRPVARQQRRRRMAARLAENGPVAIAAAKTLEPAGTVVAAAG